MGRIAIWALSLLTLVLLGTIAVLSTVKSFFGVDWTDALSLAEVQAAGTRPSLPYNGTAASLGIRDWTDDTTGITYEYERVPRILHQTWKNDTLPERWAGFSAQCREIHPDYKHMLWTDASSRDFIAEHYSWFLPTFEGYPYNIQRADAIRYFVLHKYGGVYLDLDIGCRKPVDPLLRHPVILPATKPVGVSNDMMTSEPAGPFVDTVIHNLMAFDHTYLSAYPTVMFSTGPMFLSAVLSLWNSKDARSIEQVRILPQPLYGKNIDPILAPDSFFWHYYGSSWHANDSQIFTFLGQFGKQIMNIMTVVIVLGALRLLWSYRYTLFGKICPCIAGPARSPRAGAIRLPLHSGDVDSQRASLSASRPGTPRHSHSRNTSIVSFASGPSRPSSPPPRLAISTETATLLGNGTSSTVPAPASAGSNPALGQRGSMFFLPLWYPTSSSSNSSSPFTAAQEDAPPAYVYRPFSPNSPPTAGSAEQEREQPATGWASFLSWANRDGASIARARSPNPRPDSDADAMSVHSMHTVKMGRSSS